MNAEDLITDLSALGIELQAHGDRLRFRPRSAVTPDLAERMAACKSELLTLLSGIPHWPSVTPEANEVYWTLVDEADREYLLAPRDWPDACAWCGGRMNHSTTCDSLRNSWAPILPFGKHRGRRVDEVPADYLAWVFNRRAGGELFSKELRRWRDNTERN